MEFSLYIHWPFCLKKCPYCDFNSYSCKYDSEDWVSNVIQEISIYKKIFANYKLKTIFFGGGTPSLIEPKYIKKIIDFTSESWAREKVVETTIEVNPSSIEAHNLEGFLNSGVNRISIGVQSLLDEDLKFLGRLHSSKEAKKIVEHTTKICKNVSADFIYTLPYDSLSKWKKQLHEIVSFVIKNKIKHLSLYQLTIEENTNFAQDVKQKKWLPMDQDQQSILYRYTHKMFNKLGWNQYEISNLSNNKEYECKHNLNYWKYGNYLGIGPGAHSRMILNHEKYKFNNHKSYTKWSQALKKYTADKNNNLFFLDEFEKLNAKDKFLEKIIMGLRLSEGFLLNEDEFEYLNFENLKLLNEKKFLELKDNNIKLKLRGKLRINKIIEMLVK